MNSFNNSDQADFDKIASGLNNVSNEIKSQKSILSRISDGIGGVGSIVKSGIASVGRGANRIYQANKQDFGPDTNEMKKMVANAAVGPIGAAIQQAMNNAGISFSGMIKKSISSVMNSFHGHGSKGLNLDRLEKIEQNGVQLQGQELQAINSGTAKQIQNDNANTSKIITSINSLEDSLSGKGNRRNGQGASRGDRPVTVSELRTILASSPKQNNGSGGSGGMSVGRSPGSLSSIQGRVATGQNNPADVAALLCELIKTQKEFAQNFTDPNAPKGGGILHTLWDLGKDLTGINLLFSGRYAKDIKRSPNPMETITDALIKIYEWERIGIDLSRRQLNEIIKAVGGAPQKYVGHEGVATTVLKRAAGKLKQSYDDSSFAKIPILGKLGKAGLNLGSFFLGFNDEDWKDQMSAKWYNTLTGNRRENKHLNNDHRVNEFRDAVFGSDVDYAGYGKIQRKKIMKFKGEDNVKYDQVLKDPDIARSLRDLNTINTHPDLSDKDRKKFLKEATKNLRQSIKAAEDEYGISGLMDHITEITGLGGGFLGTGHSLFGKWYKPGHQTLEKGKTFDLKDFLSNSAQKDDDAYYKELEELKKQWETEKDPQKKHQAGIKLVKAHDEAQKRLEVGKENTVKKVGDSIIPVTIVQPNQLILSALRSKIKGVPQQNFNVFKDQLAALQNIKDILEGKGVAGGVVTSPSEAAADVKEGGGDVEDVLNGDSSGQVTVEQQHLEHEEKVISLLENVVSNTDSLSIRSGGKGSEEGGLFSGLMSSIGDTLKGIGGFMMNHPLLSAAGGAAIWALFKKMTSNDNAMPNLKNPNTFEGSVLKNMINDPLKTLETAFLPRVLKSGKAGWVAPLIESYKIWQNANKGDYHKSAQGANLLYNFMANPKAGALISLSQFLGAGPLQQYLEQNMDYVVNDPILGEHKVSLQLPADDVYEGATNMFLDTARGYSVAKKYMDFAKLGSSGTTFTNIKNLQKIFDILKNRHPLMYRNLALTAEGSLMRMRPGSVPTAATNLEATAFRTAAQGEVVRGVGKTGKILGIAGGLLEGGMYGVQAYNEFKQGNIGYGLTKSAQAFISLAGLVALYAAPLTAGTSLLITAALTAAQFIIDSIVTCFKIKDKIEAQNDCENVRKMFLDVNFWTRENIKHVKEFDKVLIKYKDKQNEQLECIKELSNVYKAYLSEVGIINKISSYSWRSDKEFLDEYKELIAKIKQLTLLIKINGGNDPKISKKDYEKKTNAVSLKWDSKEVQNMFAQFYKNWVLNRENKSTQINIDERTDEDKEITEIFDPSYNNDMDFLSHSDIPTEQKDYFISRRELINRNRIARYKSFNKKQQEYLKQRKLTQYASLTSYDEDNPNISNLEELTLPSNTDTHYNVARIAISSDKFLSKIESNTAAGFKELNIQTINTEYTKFFRKENLIRSAENISIHNAYISDALSDKEFTKKIKEEYPEILSFNNSLNPDNWVPNFNYFMYHIRDAQGPQFDKVNKLVKKICDEHNILQGKRWPKFGENYIVNPQFKNAIFKTFKANCINDYTGSTLVNQMEAVSPQYTIRLRSIWTNNDINCIDTYTATYGVLYEYFEENYLNYLRTLGKNGWRQKFNKEEADTIRTKQPMPLYVIAYAQTMLIRRYMEYIISSGQIANSDYVKASKSFIIPDNNTASRQRVSKYLLALQQNGNDKNSALYKLKEKATFRLLGTDNVLEGHFNPQAKGQGRFESLDLETRGGYLSNIIQSARDIEETFGINLQNPEHMDSVGGILFQSVLDNDELSDDLIEALNMPLENRSKALETVRIKALQKFENAELTPEKLTSDIEKLLLDKAAKFPKQQTTEEDVESAKKELEEYAAKSSTENTQALANNTIAVESNNEQLISINETLRDIKTYTLSKEAMVYDRNIFMRSVEEQVRALEESGATKEQIASLLPAIYKIAATKPNSINMEEEQSSEKNSEVSPSNPTPSQNAAGGVTTEFSKQARYEPEDNAIWGEAGPEYRFTNLLGKGSHFYLPATYRPGNMLAKITEATAAKLNAEGSYNAFGPHDQEGRDAIEAISTEVAKNFKHVGFKPSELEMFKTGGGTTPRDGSENSSPEQTTANATNVIAKEEVKGNKYLKEMSDKLDKLVDTLQDLPLKQWGQKGLDAAKDLGVKAKDAISGLLEPDFEWTDFHSRAGKYITSKVEDKELENELTQEIERLKEEENSLRASAENGDPNGSPERLKQIQKELEYLEGKKDKDGNIVKGTGILGARKKYLSDKPISGDSRELFSSLNANVLSRYGRDKNDNRTVVSTVIDLMNPEQRLALNRARTKKANGGQLTKEELKTIEELSKLEYTFNGDEAQYVHSLFEDENFDLRKFSQDYRDGKIKRPKFDEKVSEFLQSNTTKEPLISALNEDKQLQEEASIYYGSEAEEPDREAPSVYEQKKAELEKREKEGPKNRIEAGEIEQLRSEVEDMGRPTPEFPFSENESDTPKPPSVDAGKKTAFSRKDRTEISLIKKNVIYPALEKNVDKFITEDHITRNKVGSAEYEEYVKQLLDANGIMDEDAREHIEAQAQDIWSTVLIKKRREVEKKLGLSENAELPKKLPKSAGVTQTAASIKPKVEAKLIKPELIGIKPPEVKLSSVPNIPEPVADPFADKENGVHKSIHKLEDRFRKYAEDNQYKLKSHLSDQDIQKSEFIKDGLEKNSKYFEEHPEEKALYDKYTDIQRLEELAKKEKLSPEETKELESLKTKYKIPLENLSYTAGLNGLQSTDEKTSLLLDRFQGNVWSHDKNEVGLGFKYKSDLKDIFTQFAQTNKGKQLSAFRDQYLQYAQGRYDEDYKLDRIKELKEKYKGLKTNFSLKDIFFTDYKMSGPGIYRNPERFLEDRRRDLNQLEFKEIMEGDGGQKSTAYVGGRYGKESKEYQEALKREQEIKAKYANMWKELEEFYTLQDAYDRHLPSANDFNYTQDSVYFEPTNGMNMRHYGEDFLKLHPEFASQVKYEKGSLFHKATVSMDEPYVSTAELKARLNQMGGTKTPPTDNKSSSQAVGEAAGMAKAVAESPIVKEKTAANKPIAPLSELASNASDELRSEAEARDIDGNPMDEKRYEQEKGIADAMANQVGVIEAAGGLLVNSPEKKKDKNTKKFAKGGLTEGLPDPNKPTFINYDVTTISEEHTRNGKLVSSSSNSIDNSKTNITQNSLTKNSPRSTQTKKSNDWILNQTHNGLTEKDIEKLSDSELEQKYYYCLYNVGGRKNAGITSNRLMAKLDEEYRIRQWKKSQDPATAFLHPVAPGYVLNTSSTEIVPHNWSSYNYPEYVRKAVQEKYGGDLPTRDFLNEVLRDRRYSIAEENGLNADDMRDNDRILYLMSKEFNEDVLRNIISRDFNHDDSVGGDTGKFSIENDIAKMFMKKQLYDLAIKMGRKDPYEFINNITTGTGKASFHENYLEILKAAGSPQIYDLKFDGDSYKAVMKEFKPRTYFANGGSTSTNSTSNAINTISSLVADNLNNVAQFAEGGLSNNIYDFISSSSNSSSISSITDNLYKNPEISKFEIERYAEGGYTDVSTKVTKFKGNTATKIRELSKLAKESASEAFKEYQSSQNYFEAKENATKKFLDDNRELLLQFPEYNRGTISDILIRKLNSNFEMLVLDSLGYKGGPNRLMFTEKGTAYLAGGNNDRSALEKEREIYEKEMAKMTGSSSSSTSVSNTANNVKNEVTNNNSTSNITSINAESKTAPNSDVAVSEFRSNIQASTSSESNSSNSSSSSLSSSAKSVAQISQSDEQEYFKYLQENVKSIASKYSAKKTGTRSLYSIRDYQKLLDEKLKKDHPDWTPKMITNSRNQILSKYAQDIYNQHMQIINSSNNVSGANNDMGSKVSQAISTTSSSFGSLFSNMLNSGSNIINKTGSSISNGITGIVNSTNNARNSIMNGIQSTFNTAGNAISNVGASVSNGIQKGVAIINGEIVPNYNVNPRIMALNTESMSTVSQSRTTEGTSEQIEKQLQKSIQAINSSNINIVKNITSGGSQHGGTVINNYDVDQTYRMIESVGIVK